MFNAIFISFLRVLISICRTYMDFRSIGNIINVVAVLFYFPYVRFFSDTKGSSHQIPTDADALEKAYVPFENSENVFPNPTRWTCRRFQKRAPRVRKLFTNISFTLCGEPPPTLGEEL